MLSLKAGVRLRDLTPQMVLAVMVVEKIMCENMGHAYECVLTSVNDGTHSDLSLHYRGRAIDFRTKTYMFDKQQLRENVKAALGDNYDVVLEDVGTENEHLHVEYDPKEVA